MGNLVRLIILFLFIAVILVYALQTFMGIENSVAIGISLIALVVSFVSSFKNELFDFSLKMISEDIVLASTTDESHESLALVVPLSLINSGYGEGVVESLAMKVINTKTKIVKLYIPIAQIDFQKFIRGKRRLDAENMLGAFSAIPFGSKEAVRIYVLFLQEKNSEKYPFSTWEPGNYRFEIYAKTSSNKGAQRIKKFEKVISAKNISSYFSGTSTFIMGETLLDL